MKSKRNEAIDHIKKAAQLLAESGNINDLVVLSDKESNILTGNFKTAEDEFDWECFNCAVCGDYHTATFTITKPKNMSCQYKLSFNTDYDWHTCSLWVRIKQGLQTAWTIIMGKTEKHDILIADGEDIRKLRDMFYRMQCHEEKIVEGK